MTMKIEVEVGVPTPDQKRCEAKGVGPGVLDTFYDRLVGLHRRCGAEQVPYVTDAGATAVYHPNRYLQTLRAAREKGDVIAYVERMVVADEPSKGFNILQVAGRLDLTVEAVVIDPEFAELFDETTIYRAALRLALATAKRLS